MLQNGFNELNVTKESLSIFVSPIFNSFVPETLFKGVYVNGKERTDS